MRNLIVTSSDPFDRRFAGNERGWSLKSVAPMYRFWTPPPGSDKSALETVTPSKDASRMIASWLVESADKWPLRRHRSKRISH